MDLETTTDSRRPMRMLASALWPPSRFSLALTTVALATTVFAAALWGQVGGKRAALYVSDAGQLAAALAATLACVRAGRRHQERRRTFWLLLAASCGAWTIGQVIWCGYDLTGSDGPPTPSWADLGFLSFVALAVASLLSHPGTRGSGARRARNLFDGLAIATALLFVSWTAVLGPLWHASDLTTLGGVVALAYPFGDAVLGFFVVLAVRGMTSADRRELWCLLGGLVALAVSDSAYAYVVQVHQYSSGDLIDVGWFLGFLMIAVGADAADVCGLSVRRARPGPTLPALLAPLLPVFVALGVAAMSLDQGRRPDTAALCMVVALVALALARQTLLVADFVAAVRSDQHGTLMSRVRYAAFRSTLSEETPAGTSTSRPRDATA